MPHVRRARRSCIENDLGSDLTEPAYGPIESELRDVPMVGTSLTTEQAVSAAEQELRLQPVSELASNMIRLTQFASEKTNGPATYSSPRYRLAATADIHCGASTLLAKVESGKAGEEIFRLVQYVGPAGRRYVQSAGVDRK